MIKLMLGDNIQTLKTLHANSVDSVVTDPPYGLSFMGKHWDYSVPSVELWREVLRVLKPGGHLLSFGGTRTYHRMVVNIEDAGFEIRDQLQWIYGSGFPKSLNISKAIDKDKGAERAVIGFNKNHRSLKETNCMVGEPHSGNGSLTAPATDLAKQWDGWGTALKPANEPIVLARKPLIGTVADNIEAWGVGGLNIDGSRIPVSDDDPNHARPSVGLNSAKKPIVTNFGSGGRPVENLNSLGRWPANVLFDEDAAAMLDEQSGVSKSKKNKVSDNRDNKNKSMFIDGVHNEKNTHSDEGGASRFFYVAKASKSERNAGLEGMPAKLNDFQRSSSGLSTTTIDGIRQKGNCGQPNQNHHPTVKPIKLMQYLIKLITPPQGVVLDPFMGSGSTGVAAKQLGFNFVGCELSEEYYEIATKRIEAANG